MSQSLAALGSNITRGVADVEKTSYQFSQSAVFDPVLPEELSLELNNQRISCLRKIYNFTHKAIDEMHNGSVDEMHDHSFEVLLSELSSASFCEEFATSDVDKINLLEKIDNFIQRQIIRAREKSDLESLVQEKLYEALSKKKIFDRSLGTRPVKNSEKISCRPTHSNKTVFDSSTALP